MKLDPTKTALLMLDFQRGILGFVSGVDAVIPSNQATVPTVDAFLAEQGE